MIRAPDAYSDPSLREQEIHAIYLINVIRREQGMRRKIHGF